MFPGSTLSDHCLRYQNIPDIKLIVVLGELGGHDEYSLVDALKSGQISKPVVAWVSGTCAKLFKSEVQFGHAGAKSGGASESAQVGTARFMSCSAGCTQQRKPPRLLHQTLRAFQIVRQISLQHKRQPHPQHFHKMLGTASNPAHQCFATGYCI